ncbi:hypothetical protein N431DRAFT_441911 [Stipitochalara longipes BDJ]|nr:hypothetical protein N431DRAFT_441911 [Stipitochalara longipes BDJ]
MTTVNIGQGFADALNKELQSTFRQVEDEVILTKNELKPRPAIDSPMGCLTHTNARITIYGHDGMPITACTDTGSPTSFISRQMLTTAFPHLQIHNFEGGLTLTFEGVNKGPNSISSQFVNLPVRCITLGKKKLEFPSVVCIVLDEMLGNLVLLGLNFLIPNQLEFRWAGILGFTRFQTHTHRLQIGESNRHIQVSIEIPEEELEALKSVPTMFAKPGLVESQQLQALRAQQKESTSAKSADVNKPRNSFHALLFDQRILSLAAIVAFFAFGMVVGILAAGGKEALDKQKYVWGVNLFLFGWVAMYGVGIAVYKWDHYQGGLLENKMESIEFSAEKYTDELRSGESLWKIL